MVDTVLWFQEWNLQFESLTIPTDRSLSCTTGTTVVATNNLGDSSEPYNPYDEIPGDRLENLYDEIHPTTRVISTITHEDSVDGRQPTAIGEETFSFASKLRGVAGVQIPSLEVVLTLYP